MFSALEHRVDLHGATVLDLFAGSGALGLEALSRGASTLLSVESHRGACDVVRYNQQTVARAVGREVSTSVYCQPVARFLSSSPDLREVTVVFLDPPYDLSEESLTAVLTDLVRLLSPGALLIVERSAKSPEPSWPGSLEKLAGKTYGDTQVFTLELSR